ncbi:hypothetical protein HA48_08260 [Pantoea wallisii]|uniref:Uncharacterized protein n=1 Tax=Pantoea wallisii TaxID=1076551 RepID=A0A1X1DAW5_9GAMM|nr:hypothetical protein [Pantoea wallisii]ORM73690.1 hypothetical protein HA48_08260 [Pantoea wallisii]
MVQINSEFVVKSHRRHLLLGGLLMLLSLLCVAMTIMFVYVNNSANRRVEDIRHQYRVISDRREAKVAELTNQVIVLQKKLESPQGQASSKAAGKANPTAGQASPPATSR